MYPLGDTGYYLVHDMMVTNFMSRLTVPPSVLNSRQVRPLNPAELLAMTLTNAKSRFEYGIRIFRVKDMRDHGMPPGVDLPTAASAANRPALLLRARVGHSIPVNPSSLFRTALTLADCAELLPVVHGTQKEYRMSIENQGLMPGMRLGRPSYVTRGRQAVHFQALGLTPKPGINLAKVPQNTDLFIYLDLQAWVNDGKAAFLSANGVINIFGTILPKYFQEIKEGWEHHPDVQRGRKGTAQSRQPSGQKWRRAASAAGGPTPQGKAAASAAKAPGGPATTSPAEAASAAERREQLEGVHDVTQLLQNLRAKPYNQLDPYQFAGQAVWDEYNDSIPEYIEWDDLSRAQQSTAATTDAFSGSDWIYNAKSGFGDATWYMLCNKAKFMCITQTLRAAQE